MFVVGRYVLLTAAVEQAVFSGVWIGSSWFLFVLFSFVLFLFVVVVFRYEYCTRYRYTFCVVVGSTVTYPFVLIQEHSD